MPSIRELRAEDLEGLRAFADREIGVGYYSAEEWLGIFERSRKDDIMFSLVVVGERGEILGLRLTYPPGNWSHGKGRGLSPERWPQPMSATAYFQSLFLSSELRGRGFGGKISARSLALLKKHGAKAVVCHSWKESPHNSSTRYLQKLGFKPLADHPRYWQDVVYNCTRCLKPPCQCTATEMHLDLENT